MRSFTRRLAMLAVLGCSPGLASAQIAPLDQTFESGTAGADVPGWFVPTPGYKSEITAEQAAEGKQSAKLFKGGTGEAPFGNLMRSLDAVPYRGRHVTLTARIRAQGEKRAMQAQMWLRVDRANGELGAFDNMDNRPVRPSDWTDAVIEADIAPDALWLNIGFISIGGATVFVDQVSLKTTGPAAEIQKPSEPKALSPRGIENLAAAARLLAYVRFFCASDQAAGVLTWDHFAAHVIEQVEDAPDAAALAERLGIAFRPLAPTLQVWAGSPESAPELPPRPDKADGVSYWKHFGAGAISAPTQYNIYKSTVEFETFADASRPHPHAENFVVKPLGGGVSCRVPLRVYRDAGGTLPHGKTPPEWNNPGAKPILSALNRSTRLAGVATAWGVFQHFYPYFDVVKTDWDRALVDALAGAADDPDEVRYLYTLRELIAKLHDGHGNVSNPMLRVPSLFPLSVEWIGKDLVVVGKAPSVPDDVKIGDIVLSIDGKSSEDCYAEVSKWISAATDGWRRCVSSQRLITNLPTADPATVSLRHPGGDAFTATLARSQAYPINTATTRKPTNGSELAPGIVYFNLCGTGSDELQQVMGTLTAAQGIVFDMRGYPAQAAFEVIQHLIDTSATSARWNVPVVTRPDREPWEWHTSGRWDMPPLTPRWSMPVVFMTNAGAISYAESIMGIIENYRLGEIVGSTTAGTNGNVNPFILPGGYSVSWTGMQVLKHDGSQHHGVGIRPTVPVEPTASGVASGRDEVLEKAVEVVKGKIASAVK